MFRVLSFLVCVVSMVYAQDRVIIGQEAYVNVENKNIQFLARIDSGARITSMHAYNIQLDGVKPLIHIVEPQVLKGKPFHEKIKNEEYKRNIGQIIHFDTMNEQGDEFHLKARVFSVARIRNAQGIEYRYVVRLALMYENIEKFVEVNLRDRSQMSYKLLIGRNWLHHDFLIQTDLKN
jgi:hypothetical protein